MSGKPRMLIVSCRWTSAITRLPRRFSSWTRSRSRRISRSFCFRIGWSAVTMRKTHRTSLKPIAIGPPPPLGMRGGALHVLAPGPAPHAPVVEDDAAAEDRVGGPAADAHTGERREVLRRVQGVRGDDLLAVGIEHDEVGVAADGEGPLLRIEAEGARGVGARELDDAREPETAFGVTLRDEVGIEERGATEPRERLPEILALVRLGAARVVAHHRVDAPPHDRVPERLAVGLRPDRRVDLAQNPVRRGVRERQVVQRRFEPDVEVRELASSLRGRRESLYAREVEQVDGAARRVGQHHRLGDRQPLGQRWAGAMVALEAARPVDLVELLRRHDAEVVAEVRVCVARRGGDDLGKDRAIRTTLVEVVLARPEVAQHRRDATRERGGGLARRVGGEVTVDADVKVRVDRPRKDEATTRVHDVGRIPGRDPVGERGDATVADTDIAAEGTDVGHDDGAVEHGRVVARHGADYTIMTISRGSTALLLLDLQRDFLDPDGVYARHGLPVSRLRGIIPTIARVAAASRVAHVPIFASKFTVYTSPAGAPLGLDHIVKARPFLRTTGFRLGDRGRELIPELGPVDYELDKPRFSAFHGTPLEVLLRSLEIDTVVLTGIVTHGGVEGTARDAMIRDFSVVILEDCVAAFDEELHLASLRGMGMYVTVMDAAAYLKALAE